MKIKVGYLEYKTMEVEINTSIVADYLASDVAYPLLDELDKILGNPNEICTVYLDDEVIYEN